MRDRPTKYFLQQNGDLQVYVKAADSLRSRELSKAYLRKRKTPGGYLWAVISNWNSSFNLSASWMGVASMDYAVGLIHEEDGVFGISLPDFPGCVSTARSLNQVIEKGGQALSLHVSGMIEDGEAMPSLHSPSELRANPQFAGGFVDATLCAVAVEIPRR